jgi:Transposase
METLVALRQPGCAQDSVTACARVPGGHGGLHAETRRFTTTTAGLGAVGRVAGQLRGDPGRDGVDRVLLEAGLAAARGPGGVLAAERGPPAQRAGRKTDMADAAWIAQLVEHGLVRPSFVPPRPIRELRELTRYRKTQIQERGREVQRLDKVLQDAGIKLSSVATDVLVCPVGRCWKPWWPAPTNRRCWPPWPRVGSGPSCRRCGRRWPAGSGPTITGCWSPRSWPTSTTWTRPSPSSLRGSSR